MLLTRPEREGVSDKRLSLIDNITAKIQYAVTGQLSRRTRKADLSDCWMSHLLNGTVMQHLQQDNQTTLSRHSTVQLYAQMAMNYLKYIP